MRGVLVASVFLGFLVGCKGEDWNVYTFMAERGVEARTGNVLDFLADRTNGHVSLDDPPKLLRYNRGFFVVEDEYGIQVILLGDLFKAFDDVFQSPYYEKRLENHDLGQIVFRSLVNDDGFGAIFVQRGLMAGYEDIKEIDDVEKTVFITLLFDDSSPE